MLQGAIAFGVFAIVGLLAAKRPHAFARYFLAEWQRQRLPADMSGISSVGWLIFGGSLLTAIALLIAGLLQHP